MVEEDLGVPEEQASFGAVMGNSPSMRQLFGFSRNRADRLAVAAGRDRTGKEISRRVDSQRSKRGPSRSWWSTAGRCSDADREQAVRARGARVSPGRSPIATARSRGRRRQRLSRRARKLPLDLQPKLLRVLEGGHGCGASAKTSTAPSTCASSRHAPRSREGDRRRASSAAPLLRLGCAGAGAPLRTGSTTYRCREPLREGHGARRLRAAARLMARLPRTTAGQRARAAQPGRARARRRRGRPLRTSRRRRDRFRRTRASRLPSKKRRSGRQSSEGVPRRAAR